jgi:transcriptional regulator with XRE-family HTH domain
MEINPLILIGERLISIRKYNNLSISALAKIAGVSSQAISDIENNVTMNPKTSLVKNICEKLDVSYDWLINGTGSMVRNVKQNDNENSSLLAEKDKRIEELKTMLEKSNDTINFFQNLVNNSLGLISKDLEILKKYNFGMNDEKLGKYKEFALGVGVFSKL